MSSAPIPGSVLNETSVPETFVEKMLKPVDNMIHKIHESGLDSSIRKRKLNLIKENCLFVVHCLKNTGTSIGEGAGKMFDNAGLDLDVYTALSEAQSSKGQGSNQQILIQHLEILVQSGM